MQVDVVHIARSDTCIRYRQLYSASRFLATLLQTNPVEGLAGRAVAGHLGQDWYSTRAGMLIVFEEEHPATFGSDEAIAVRRKRT